MCFTNLPSPSPTVTAQKCECVCVYMCFLAPTWPPELMNVCVRFVYVCLCVWWLCAADLCVLFQKESPNTSRQSPANGHSSINSSILVRTPSPRKTPPPSPQTDPQPFLSPLSPSVRLIYHADLSWYIYMFVSLEPFVRPDVHLSWVVFISV